MRMRALLAAIGVVGAMVPMAVQATADTIVACEAPTVDMEFEQDYIDETRAGGEPILETLQDGTLLWGSHAGTTHFYSPTVADQTSAAFVQNYEGQTYQYWSDDDGATWHFSPRNAIQSAEQGSLAGVNNSGFSDPVFAEDMAGNVFISEINLANIAVSKSTDSGRTWTLQNFFGLTVSDRQWMAADEEDVVYMTANGFGGGSLGNTVPGAGNLGNYIYKSSDGGVTWSRGHSTGGSSSSDIKVDWNTGAVYQPQQSNGLRLAVWPNARAEDFSSTPTVEYHTIFDGYRQQSSIGPTIELDDAGNIYATWDQDSGNDDYPPGIYFAASQDGGKNWTEPVRVDEGPEHSFWPWLEVGAEGAVGIAWLENENIIASENAEDATADSAWHVMAAQTFDAFGNDDADCDVAGFNVVQASTAPVHHGTVCTGGTVCQARAVDRRLGDYFGNEIASGGGMVIAVSDTQQGGSVALPLGIRQVAGPSFTEPGVILVRD
ncbi:hypothetical protein DVS28_a2091 [Euzebya pacifica]|uniref:Exo-alpha-sialidase n=1 Tax=Euzebya pacifica TaxID=1608957 RepID=A0A346XX28_9ACTN|nr:sialidase family protein [Euzebya pacifica]AXV06775.1 hypothetical protein DVS28_a2091 [Euzebya pacifica]